MTTFLMGTRIDSSVVGKPTDLEELEKAVVARVEQHCPDVQWQESFAILGPYDYIDRFEAPDLETAQKVATIVRSFGHARAEVWPATPWDSFKRTIQGLS